MTTSRKYPAIGILTDPVCGMAVDKKNPPARTLYEDNEYLFCSLDCRRKFDKNPTKYCKETGEKQQT